MIQEFRKDKREHNLTEGPIIPGMIRFILPLLAGQALQLLYHLTDAWIIGNYAGNGPFAAVNSSSAMAMLVVGFCTGMSAGGSVVISRCYGQRNMKRLTEAVNTNLFFGILLSVLATVFGVLLAPHILRWMSVPADILPDALTYFRVYFAGVSTIIMYNICMAIQRALGDSLHPLFYLLISVLINVVLDYCFVAQLGMGVFGAAFATVIAQGTSVLLCLIRLTRAKDEPRIRLRNIRLYPDLFREVLRQGLPSGFQSAAISIGNVVVQSHFNMLGTAAVAGYGAYSKIEGFVFLPIVSISMALPTFVGQNLGAAKYDRVRKGGIFGIAAGVILAELIGVVFWIAAPQAIGVLVKNEASIAYGVLHAHITTGFYALLAFSHTASGVLRGSGRSFLPMATMLCIWCVIRTAFVTIASRIVPGYATVAWVYPLTWTLSSIVLLIFLIRTDWIHSYAG